MNDFIKLYLRISYTIPRAESETFRKWMMGTFFPMFLKTGCFFQGVEEMPDFCPFGLMGVEIVTFTLKPKDIKILYDFEVQYLPELLEFLRQRWPHIDDIKKPFYTRGQECEKLNFSLTRELKAA